MSDDKKRSKKKRAPDEKPEQSPPENSPEETEQSAEPSAEDTPEEKTYTLTQAQMDAAEEAAKQLAEQKEQLLRLTAEYENYRRRTAKEKETTWQTAKAETIQPFLAVYDNLERAAAAEGDDESPHKKGLEMIFSQYQEILIKLGVTKMDAQGQPFDPSLHNAVMHIEDESLGENVVADVLQAGFMMGEKVLRVATVRVAN